MQSVEGLFVFLFLEGRSLAFRIATDVCEGIGDCMSVCPTQAIDWVKGMTNSKGTKYVAIDQETCSSCGACRSVCPIEGAILNDRGSRYL